MFRSLSTVTSMPTPPPVLLPLCCSKSRRSLGTGASSKALRKKRHAALTAQVEYDVGSQVAGLLRDLRIRVAFVESDSVRECGARGLAILVDSCWRLQMWVCRGVVPQLANGQPTEASGWLMEVRGAG